MGTYSAPIERFICHLGKKPYCTDDLGSGVVIRGKQNALRRSYVSLNQRLRWYIALDIDYEGGGLAYEDVGLEPTIIITNPDNAHAHLLYELASPVSFGDKSHSRPQHYYQAVRRGMEEATKADIGYSGLITKNPVSARWRVTSSDVRYSLDDIAEYCTPLGPFDQINRRAEGLGRNCTIFDEVRRWAYSKVGAFLVYEAWYQCVLGQCVKQNTFSPPLPQSEIKATAKSIAKWTWQNRFNFGDQKNRGAANVDKNLSVRERQALGADYTNRQRATQTEHLVRKAVADLMKAGERVGATALTRKTGLSRSTINNHRHLWNS